MGWKKCWKEAFKNIEEKLHFRKENMPWKDKYISNSFERGYNVYWKPSCKIGYYEYYATKVEMEQRGQQDRGSFLCAYSLTTIKVIIPLLSHIDSLSLRDTFSISMYGTLVIELNPQTSMPFLIADNAYIYEFTIDSYASGYSSFKFTCRSNEVMMSTNWNGTISNQAVEKKEEPKIVVPEVSVKVETKKKYYRKISL